MKINPVIIILLTIACFIVFTSNSNARPREDVAKIKAIAKLPEAEQLTKDNQQALQDWFLDNVKYYNAFLKGMEIENQGIVKIDSTGKIKAALGKPGTEKAGYYIRFLKSQKDPATLSPYITFPSDNVTVNGQNDNTCNHEGWHAVLGNLSFQEVYHYNLSATQADAPRYYNGNSQPEKTEHVYMENSQALIEWLELLKDNNFEKEIISAGEKALTELKKNDPNVTEVDISKLDLKTQKELLQKVKDIYFMPLVIRERSEIYPMSATLKKELLDYCGMTFANPDEIDNFYKNGGLKTSDGKKIILPDWLFCGDEPFTTSIVILNLLDPNPYKNISDTLLESEIGIRPLHTANYSNGNYIPVSNTPPTKGILTFKLEDQSDDTFIGVSVSAVGEKPKQLKSASGSASSKMFTFDIGDFIKNDLQGKPSMITFFVTLYLKNPNDLKGPESYNLFVKYEDNDYARKLSNNTYGSATQDYKFEVDPSKFEVKITSTNTDNKYSFKLEANKKFKNYHWVIKDENRSTVYDSRLSTDILNYEFKNPGKYEISVRPLNDKDKYVKGAILNIEITGSKDEIEKAYKAKDWKKLLELLKKASSDEDKKLIKVYLKNIADEKFQTIKKYLDAMTAYQKAENETYDKYKVKAAAEAKQYRENKNDAAARKIEKCMSDSYNKYTKTKDQIESDLYHLEQLSNDYKSYQYDYPSESFFQSCDEIQLGLNFDPSKPLNTSDYEQFCSNPKAVEDDKKLKVILKASKTNANIGEAIPVLAKIQYTKTSLMCPEEEDYIWEGNHIGDGSKVDFMASKPGTYTIGVVVKCMDQVLGNDSVKITVGGSDISGEIKGLNEQQIYFGSSKKIELQSDTINKATSSAGNSNNFIVEWHSTPNLLFEPQEGTSTTVTFNEMDTVKIFAEILEEKNGLKSTVGRSNLVELDVISPKFSISFDPPQNQAKIGNEIKARIISEPDIPEKLVNYRWVEPTDKMEYKNGEIGFKPKTKEPIKFHVIARVPISGETINDQIKAQYTPGEYVVNAILVGPKFDKNSQEWDPSKPGLVTKNRALVTGQQIEASVTTEGIEPDKVHYSWSSNEGCHIDSVTISDRVTVSRSEPGPCELKVIAYNKDNNKLGEDTLSFNIQEQDTGSGNNKNKDDKNSNKKEKDENIKKAITKANDEEKLGNLEQAIKTIEEALTKYPDSPELIKKLEELKNKKKQVEDAISTINSATSNGDFKNAETAIKNIESQIPNSPVITQLKDKIKKAKEQFVQNVIKESNTTINSGDLES
ncbi:MAG: hypothetical protein AB1782_14835, partial [Cyanobacteriota bacterium]